MSAPPPQPHLSPPSRSGGNQWMVPAIIGALLATMALAAAGAGLWFIQRSSLFGPATVTSGVSPEGSQLKAQGLATIGYWTGICESDRKLNAKFEGILGSTAPHPMSPAEQMESLFKMADIVQQALPNWKSEISRLPMLNVDEALLSHMRENIRSADELNDAMSNLSTAGRALVQWNQAQASPSPDLWSDLVDSFTSGLMGHPFAGYEKAKAKEAQLNAQGQQLSQTYFFYSEALTKLFSKVDEESAKELELRSKLTAKYGIEFPARPEPFEGK